MLPGRGNKKKACIQFAVWHYQPRGPHWLFVPSCFWHQEHASALCLSLVSTVLVPDPHLTSWSIANTHWTFIGALDTSWFLPLPTLCFHSCPCMTATGPSGDAEISFPPSSPCSSAINMAKSNRNGLEKRVIATRFIKWIDAYFKINLLHSMS